MAERKGFTLLEIVISTGILAFALCVILGVYMSCLVLTDLSKNINIASHAAISVMDRIRSAPFSRIMPDYNGINFVVNNIPLSRGVVYVNNSNPRLLRVTITVCWQQKTRIIGEDANLNGVLDAGEDLNNNGTIDSPVQITTLIANR